MTITELIAALTSLLDEYGDLPCGGESGEYGVKLTVCDESGHEVSQGEEYCGPAHDVYIEVR